MPQTRVVPNPRGSVIIDRRLLGKQRVSAGGGHDERRHPQSRAEETRTRRNSPGGKVVLTRHSRSPLMVARAAN